MILMFGSQQGSRALRMRFCGIAFLATCTLLAACTTYQPLDPDELSRVDVVLKSGDDVRIVTLSGEQIDLKIASIEPDVVASYDTHVPVSDIRALAVKTTNRRRAWIIAGAVVGAVLLSIDYDDGDCVECFPVFP